jgi:octaprenyl-diphosphate synthase
MDEIRRIVVNDLELLDEVNDVFLQMRGKLFRPTLLLLVNEVGGRPHPDALSLAAVVELVHLATLVHDDAVDHSVLRRGLPTINHLWNHQVAIISGDYLYTRSVVELARLERMDAIQSLARAANEMTVGELRQLTSYDALEFTEDDYRRLIASKTASLMSAACEIGALVGPSEYRDAFRRYGHALGMAFQVADDLLDYDGSEELTGKPVGHDLRERKVTLPLVHALRQVTEAERARVRASSPASTPPTRRSGRSSRSSAAREAGLRPFRGPALRRRGPDCPGRGGGRPGEPWTHSTRPSNTPLSAVADAGVHFDPRERMLLENRNRRGARWGGRWSWGSSSEGSSPASPRTSFPTAPPVTFSSPRWRRRSGPFRGGPGGRGIDAGAPGPHLNVLTLVGVGLVPSWRGP